MENKKKTIQVGEKLLKVLEELKLKIKEVTWQEIEPSYYELGEILAKKVKEANLI